MKRISLLLTILVAYFIESPSLFAYSGGCTFVGQNVQVALEHTQALLDNIKMLKESSNCKIGEQSVNSLERVSRYMKQYSTLRGFEQQHLAEKAEVEQFQMAYDTSKTEEERSYWMNELLSAKTREIIAGAQVTLGKQEMQDELVISSLQDFSSELATVMQSTSTLNDCFISKPELAGLVLSGVVNLAGSVASIATVNPIWGGIGGTIGQLISTVASYINNYQWNKYIKLIDKNLLYHTLVCSIEMQSNFYCEKNDEIGIIKKIMRDLESNNKEMEAKKEIWVGLDIEANYVPVIQNWIKNLYRGLPPSSVSDAQDQNQLLVKVNSAELIQNQILGKFRKFEEDFNEGSGEKLNLMIKNISEISSLMGGDSPESSGSIYSRGEMDTTLIPGQAYFKGRILAQIIPYALVFPPDGSNFDNLPSAAPKCPGGSDYCDKVQLFLEFLKEKYNAGDTFTPETLKRILDVASKRIEYIFAKVNLDIESDLARQRIRDPEVLLSRAKNSQFPYRFSAEKSFQFLNHYLEDLILLLSKYYKFSGGVNDICQSALSSESNKLLPSYQTDLFSSISLYMYENRYEKPFITPFLDGGPPVELFLACETKQMVDDIVFLLSNNSESAKDRILKISKIFRFASDRTLYFLTRINELLRIDLNIRIELGMLTPSVEDMLLLKEKDLILKLIDEQSSQLVNYNQAIKERESAKALIRDNFNVLVQMTPLRERITSVVKELESESTHGNEYKSKFGESCAILLSLPFSKRQSINWYSGGQQLLAACKHSLAESEWNQIRQEMGLSSISDLNINFDEVYDKSNYPDRICTYRNYLRKNTIYGIKKRREQKI